MCVILQYTLLPLAKIRAAHVSELHLYVNWGLPPSVNQWYLGLIISLMAPNPQLIINIIRVLKQNQN